MVTQFDKSKAEAVLRLLEANSEARLLDLGCADGKFTSVLAKTVGARET
jgi:cyclopropane fatty-acyl-phospholipid synthase-like methyltransferase